MRTLFNTLKLVWLVLLVGRCLVATAHAQSAKLEMAQLDHLGAKASETVDVNIDERLMQLTAKFFSSKDPDEAKVKEIINGLKGIYVKSFQFERDGEYTTTDIDSIRSQLRGLAWSKVVNVNSKKDGTVEVYLMTSAARIGGLVVVASDAKALTIVNIVGPVDLEKLSQLEGQFGVPDLGIEITKPKQKN